MMAYPYNGKVILINKVRKERSDPDRFLIAIEIRIVLVTDNPPIASHGSQEPANRREGIGGDCCRLWKLCKCARYLPVDAFLNRLLVSFHVVWYCGSDPLECLVTVYHGIFNERFRFHGWSFD